MSESTYSNGSELFEITTLFEQGGVLGKSLTGFEAREGQQKMAEAIGRNFEKKGVLVCEAGTGVGKTFAYLIPAILWSQQTGEKVVVSTNTINLQEQIFNKDLPDLRRAGFDFKAVLVKGIRNYVCLLKLIDAQQEIATNNFFTIDKSDVDPINRIVATVESCRGDRSQFDPLPTSEIWEKVSTESEFCLKKKCRYYDACFYYRCRSRAANANLIIANHALLFADLSVRARTQSYDKQALFPPYKHIVVDEAHHIEDNACHYFGSQTSWLAIRMTYGRFQHRRNLKKGILPKLINKITQLIPNQQANCVLAFIETDLYPAFRETADQLEFDFETLFDAFRRYGRSMSTGRREDTSRRGGETQHRFTDAFYASTSWNDQFKPIFLQISGHLIRFCNRIKGLIDAIEDALGENEKKRSEFSGELQTLKAVMTRLTAAVETISELCQSHHVLPMIKWVELKSSKRFGRMINIHCTPLDIGPLLKKYCYDPFATFVATSATITVNNRFDFFTERTGMALLEEGRLQVSQFKSPFNLKEQMLLTVPNDLPSPGNGHLIDVIKDDLLAIINRSQGHALFLFTSYSALNHYYQSLFEPLCRLGLCPLKQGDASRSALVSQFKRRGKCVLFGTDSFWEGIDIKGSVLRLVIIPRLPFVVPTDPLVEARSENIERQGGHGFRDYHLPLAVLKFKQGVGRLIRSKKDRGVVVILDNRLLTKSYGQSFLSAIDNRPLCKPLAEVMRLGHDYLVP